MKLRSECLRDQAANRIQSNYQKCKNGTYTKSKESLRIKSWHKLVGWPWLWLLLGSIWSKETEDGGVWVLHAVSLLKVALEGHLAAWSDRVTTLQRLAIHMSQLGATKVRVNKAVEVGLGRAWVENGEGRRVAVGHLGGLTVG